MDKIVILCSPSNWQNVFALLLIHSVEMRITFEYSNVTIQSYHLRLPFHYPLRWQLQTTEEGTPVLELLYFRSYYH